MKKLKFEKISKYFPGVKALNDISFECHAGQVHALMGENGAGKSTLLKILSGMYTPSLGGIYIDDKLYEFKNTKDALDAKISIIYQELNIIPEMTVAENIFLGQIPHKQGIVQKNELLNEAQKLLNKLDLQVKPTDLLTNLSIGQWQMIEIAKALSRGANIIAFDEPTSSLTAPEIKKLFSVIEDLKKEGKIILYVSHRMEEIFQISDAITVLKDGQFVETFSDLSLINNDILIKSMVGRELENIYNYQARTLQDTYLELKNVSAKALKGDFSFSVKKGEILGLFGLVGAGRSELLKIIFGYDPVTKGGIYVDGKKLNINSVSTAITNGIVLCPEDRKKESIITSGTVQENINISSRPNHAFYRFFINNKWEEVNATHQCKARNVKTPSINQMMVNLSGGNQQKAILGRWLSQDINIMLLDEPTRGIDIGAKSEIYNMIFKLAKEGVTIIVVSSDLPEVIGIADRIMVMRDKQIAGFVAREEATEEKILKMAMPS